TEAVRRIICLGVRAVHLSLVTHTIRTGRCGETLGQRWAVPCAHSEHARLPLVRSGGLRDVRLGYVTSDSVEDRGIHRVRQSLTAQLPPSAPTQNPVPGLGCSQ